MKPTVALKAVLAAIALGQASCAWVAHGSDEQISVTSDPPGATVTMADGSTHVTPFDLTVPRKQDLQLHFSKPGYQAADLSDNSQVEGGFLLADILFLNLPMVVDAPSGALYSHQQLTVTAHLNPESGTSPATPGKPASRQSGSTDHRAPYMPVSNN